MGLYMITAITRSNEEIIFYISILYECFNELFYISSIEEKEVEMKKKKFVGLTALILLALFNFASLPVYAEVTEFQTADTNAEETSAECQVIYKSTYDFSEEIPKYPELDVNAYGYEGVYDGKPHGITVDCGIEEATILYSADGKNYSTKKPEYTNAGTYVTYYKVEKKGYSTTTGSAVVKIKEATIEFDADDCITFYDGKKHSIDLSVKTDDCKILYSEDGIKFTSKKPEYKEPGTYVVCYKITRDNYATITGSSTVTIKAKDGAVNDNSQNNSNRNSQNNNSQSNSQVDGNPDAGISKVQTGDESNIFLYTVMLIASVFGLLKNRDKEEKRKL